VRIKEWATARAWSATRAMGTAIVAVAVGVEAASIVGRWLELVDDARGRVPFDRFVEQQTESVHAIIVGLHRMRAANESFERKLQLRRTESDLLEGVMNGGAPWA
jgi:hypothetical protein